MPIGMIVAMLMPYIAQLVGQSGNQPTSASGAAMDPTARRLLLGNEPGTQPTGPGFAMDTDPWLMGLLQLQARQQMRLDPLNADIVNLTRRLMPTGLLEGLSPTEPGSSLGGGGGTSPTAPSPTYPPGVGQTPTNPGGEPTGPTVPLPTAPPGSPGTPKPPKGPPQAITASGLDGGIQKLMASLSGSGQGQMNGDGFSLPNWLDQLPQYKKRIGY